MCTYVHAYLLDDSVSVRGPKAFLKVLALGDLPFRDVDEDIADLKDVIEICLDPVPPFLDFVLVACDLTGDLSIRALTSRDHETYLKSLPALLEPDD